MSRVRVPSPAFRIQTRSTTLRVFLLNSYYINPLSQTLLSDSVGDSVGYSVGDSVAIYGLKSHGGWPVGWGVGACNCFGEKTKKGNLKEEQPIGKEWITPSPEGAILKDSLPNND